MSSQHIPSTLSIMSAPRARKRWLPLSSSIGSDLTDESDNTRETAKTTASAPPSLNRRGTSISSASASVSISSSWDTFCRRYKTTDGRGRGWPATAASSSSETISDVGMPSPAPRPPVTSTRPMKSSTVPMPRLRSVSCPIHRASSDPAVSEGNALSMSSSRSHGSLHDATGNRLHTLKESSAENPPRTSPIDRHNPASSAVPIAPALDTTPKRCSRRMFVWSTTLPVSGKGLPRHLRPLETCEEESVSSDRNQRREDVDSTGTPGSSFAGALRTVPSATQRTFSSGDEVSDIERSCNAPLVLERYEDFSKFFARMEEGGYDRGERGVGGGRHASPKCDCLEDDSPPSPGGSSVATTGNSGRHAAWNALRMAPPPMRGWAGGSEDGEADSDSWRPPQSQWGYDGTDHPVLPMEIGSMSFGLENKKSLRGFTFSSNPELNDCPSAMGTAYSGEEFEGDDEGSLDGHERSNDRNSHSHNGPMGEGQDRENHDDDDGKSPAQGEDEEIPAAASSADIFACQFHRWYPTFRTSRPRTTTFKSAVIPVPDQFVEYLLADGVTLPVGCPAISSTVGGGELSDDSDSEDNESCASSKDATCPFAFPDLDKAVTEAIQKLGGQVLPKLNWSAPKDAAWMNGGSLSCRTAGDVYVLLKSSDFVLHDLLHPWEGVPEDVHQEGSNEYLNLSRLNLTVEITNPQPMSPQPFRDREKIEYNLVLRKWCKLQKGMEFRCFVGNHKLVAISQRDHTQHYPYLFQDRYRLRDDILEFFYQYILNIFNSGQSPDYVFDCYIDSSRNVWVVDFNVWGTRTDALLYQWKELVKLKKKFEEDIAPNTPVESKQDDDDDNSYNEEQELLPEIRLVTDDNVHHDPLASYRAPIDTVDLAGGESFSAFMAMCEQPSALVDESSSDDN